MYLLTLPFRIAFGVLLAVICLPIALLVVPFLLLRVAVKTAVALVVLPFVLLAVAIGVVMAAVTFSIALIVPMLPLAFLGLCIWAVVKLVSRPAPSPV